MEIAKEIFNSCRALKLSGSDVILDDLVKLID